MYWKQTVALAAALVVSGAGCGGSKPLSRAEFVKRADTVCDRVRNQERSLIRNAPALMRAQHLSQAKASTVFRARFIAFEHDRLQELESLVPPVTLQDAFTQWMDDVRINVNEIARPEKTPTAAEDAKRYALGVQRERLRTQLGLRRC